MQICVMIHHVRVAPKYRPTWPQGTREADHPRAMNASTTVSITTHHIHDPANCTYYPARARAPRCDPRRPLLRLTERLVVLGPRTCSRLNWHVRTGRERVNSTREVPQDAVDITYLTTHLFIRRASVHIAHYVGWFYVPMNNPMPMEMICSR